MLFSFKLLFLISIVLFIIQEDEDGVNEECVLSEDDVLNEQCFGLERLLDPLSSFSRATIGDSNTTDSTSDMKYVTTKLPSDKYN